VTHVDLEHDGEVRSYEIHVPPAYDGETPFPLVLSFQGLTSTGLLQ
jgi:poly(3-hydroxybutyrate) depolymerase